MPMKHLRTLEDDYLKFLKTLPSLNLSHDGQQKDHSFESPGMPAQNKHINHALPGKSVINNILNYARALEVFKKSDGVSFLVVNN